MGASMGGSGGRSSRNSRRGFAEINVTPFVDVMLVLLVIFMVAAPMMTTGVTVDLPSSKADPVQGNDEPLSITVNAKGEVYLQNTKVEIAALGEKLKAITGEKKETRIFIRGDKGVDYGRVMSVMGALNAAGFTKVALITDSSFVEEGKP
jgi:biopolymer transport protein TolR